VTRREEIGSLLRNSFHCSEDMVTKVYSQLLRRITVAALQQLRVILLEPFTEDLDFIFRAFFGQKSLLPQGYEPLPSGMVFQLVRTHTQIILRFLFPRTAAHLACV